MRGPAGDRKHMKILSVGLLNGLSVGVRLGALLAINKLLAVSFGPAGYAQYGSFQNVFQIALNIGMLGLGNGTTHFTASITDPAVRRRYWAAATKLTVLSSIGAALVAFPFLLQTLQPSEMISNRFMLPLAVSLLVPLACLQGHFQAILNGLGRVNWYVSISVLASLLTLLISGLAGALDQIEPALMALPIGAALSLLMIGPMAFKSLQLKLSALWGPLHSDAARHLLAFGVVTMVASCLTPISQLQIRDGITLALGSETAGIWEGAQRLSSSYSLVLTSLVGVYFLPKFSKCVDDAALFVEIRKAVGLLVPISVVMGIALYHLRYVSIDLLFNASFRPMAEMMAVQCIGDTLRIVAWIFAYALLSRKKHLRYLTAEATFTVVHVGLAAALQSTQGLQGLAFAYAAACAVYVAMVFPGILRLKRQT